MIQGIFYARFFPQEGPKIVAQSPAGCITPVEGSTKSPLIDFDVLHEYIIPRQAFCNRYLTINTPDGKYTVLGYPVVIPHTKYLRNEFIFNFGLVLDADVDHVPYERVVRGLASTFSEMEKQNEYLSQNAETKGSGRRPIDSLLEIVKEDLDNYGECMIPVDEANTINMKLFPHHMDPPRVRGWHVPVPKAKFSDIMDPTWDLTLQKVISHIDGVSDVRRIAHAASVSLELAKTALRHLLYYDTILLLDMFFFTACYAPRPGIHDFIRNVDGMVDECAAYVSHGRGLVSKYHLIKLMSTFAPGKSVMEWLKGHQDTGFEVLRFVDVRRFVQFGVIKGCIYRVHKFVVSKQYLAATSTPPSIIHHPDHHFTSFISPYHHNFTSSSYRLHIKSKMTRSHKANDRDHKGIAEGTALPTETVPRFFGKNGFADVDPKKVKKDGSGRGNWGTVNDDIADEQFTFTNTRRRSNSSSFSHHVSDLKTKFEVNEPEPVFEESLHGPEEEDQEDLSKTDSSESGRSSS